MARIEIQFKTVVGRHGTFSYLPNDVFVGRSLDLYGEFSEQETVLFQQLLGPGGVAVEAGANLGALTVPIAKAVGPTGKVFAYEPQRVIAALLRRNVAQNGLAHVEVREAALGRAPGSLRVPELDYRAVENFGGLSLTTDRGHAVAVETIDALNLSRLDLIKADVEGMELDVLEGAARSIARLRPILYVENNRDDRSKQLIATIFRFGYRAWWYAAPLFNANNHLKQSNNVFGDTISINMFCIPNEREIGVVGGVPVIGEDDTRDAAGERVRARLASPPAAPAPKNGDASAGGVAVVGADDTRAAATRERARPLPLPPPSPKDGGSRAGAVPASAADDSKAVAAKRAPAPPPSPTGGGGRVGAVPAIGAGDTRAADATRAPAPLAPPAPPAPTGGGGRVGAVPAIGADDTRAAAAKRAPAPLAPPAPPAPKSGGSRVGAVPAIGADDTRAAAAKRAPVPLVPPPQPPPPPKGGGSRVGGAPVVGADDARAAAAKHARERLAPSPPPPPPPPPARPTPKGGGGGKARRKR